MINYNQCDLVTLKPQITEKKRAIITDSSSISYLKEILFY